MTLAFVLLFFLYLLFVALLMTGWNMAKRRRVAEALHFEPLVSIIIPVRNEGLSIGSLLDDIKNQSYKNFEVIVVDDHSVDHTAEVVISYTQQNTNFTLMHSQGEGKKIALAAGIRVSKGEIIVTTDGDCRVQEHWLTTTVKYFQVEDTKMVFGGVKMVGASFFATLQAHEFLSLIGTAAATLSLGAPSICNGANLAFRNSAFREVGGYDGNFHIPSGDDEFLLQKIFQLYPNGVQFVFNQNAVVKTSPAYTLKDFVYQRIRWAGKWRHNLCFRNIILAIFIFCFQMSVLLLPVLAFVGSIDPLVAFTLLILKAIIESMFLKKVASFLDIRWNWGAMLLLQIIYPFYAVLIGLISCFGRFEWKGRKLSSYTLSMAKK